jgi:hypothetical protein
MLKHIVKVGLIGTLVLCPFIGHAGADDAPKAKKAKEISFDMVVSAGAASCVPNATASVDVVSTGATETMTVSASGLPPNTDFDFFVIQVPTAPFGMSWYQGDVEADENGNATAVFVGRFSIETFVIAPGVAAAPQTFTKPPFPDATQNPETIGPDGQTTGPVQMYHLGMWFDSPKEAAANGCADTVTPFNGTHNAGIQVLNTSNYPDTTGPLINLE